MTTQHIQLNRLTECKGTFWLMVLLKSNYFSFFHCTSIDVNQFSHFCDTCCFHNITQSTLFLVITITITVIAISCNKVTTSQANSMITDYRAHRVNIEPSCLSKKLISKCAPITLTQITVFCTPGK